MLIAVIIFKFIVGLNHLCLAGQVVNNRIVNNSLKALALNLPRSVKSFLTITLSIDYEEVVLR